mgnify:CR=1 FL=1
MKVIDVARMIYPTLKTIEIGYDVQLENVKNENDTITKCIYIGNSRCNKPVYKEWMCKEHYNLIESKKINSKVFEISNTFRSKTQQKEVEINQLLNKIKPQTIYKLYRHELGLLEKSTNIVFADDFEVIGKLGSDGTLKKLSTYDADTCERKGWVYSIKIVNMNNEDIEESDEESI